LDWCEENQGEAFRCNVVAPLKAFRHWKKEASAECRMFVHLSSGCVWDGPFPPIGLGFEPYEPVTPACFYSWTKAACDALMLQESDGYNLALLRPRQVYSPLASPRNTLTKLNGYVGLIDTPNSMTSAETIARTIERLARCPTHVRNGRIMNVYDLNATSPFRVGAMLADAGMRFQPAQITKEKLDKTLVPKRVDVVLEDRFFEDLVDPPEIENELARVIEEFAMEAKNR
jgi:nucleoside-diphosphate-sugar epimerase